MTKLEREIHIDAPPSEVYDKLMDPDCLGQWVTIQDSIEERPDGDLEKGSELVQRVKIAGRRFRLKWKVSQADPGRKAIWQGRGPMGSKARCVYELEPNEGGTVFTYTNEYDIPGGPAGRLVGRAIMSASGGEADKSLKRLKKLIEKG
jgi:carbon monoxide dehydrogenase subunit G